VFENIGWAEILVLVVAGLFILGPERLPEAARWLGSAIKQVRDYATGARDHLRKELGPEFDEIQQPLNDLRGLRNFNPKTAISRTLFAEDEPTKPNGYAPTANGTPASVTSPASNGASAPAASNGASAPPASNGAAAPMAPPAPAAPAAAPAPTIRPPRQPLLYANERPPIDPDAT
jgi:sec-independent protein translocase protein TatB